MKLTRRMKLSAILHMNKIARTASGRGMAKITITIDKGEGDVNTKEFEVDRKVFRRYVTVSNARPMIAFIQKLLDFMWQNLNVEGENDEIREEDDGGWTEG